jgi:hypothetical protein
MHCEGTIYFICKNVILILMAFIFLTFFFFNYVTGFEEEEYVKQLNIVVDNIYEENKDDINEYKKEIDLKNPPIVEGVKNSDLIFLGAIGTSNDIQDLKNTEETKRLKDANESIKNMSYKLVLCACFIIFFTIFLFYALSSPDCDFTTFLKNMSYENILGVMCIGLTEFMFLNIVTRNYISADSNLVKNKISKSLLDYIDKNK